MDSKLSINLFGGVTITKDGESVLDSLANTRKTKLFLAYIILNKDRPVTHKELFELLWSGQEYANPGTALRTLLYRYRSAVADLMINELVESIISKKGTYIWNSEVDIAIDIYEFEKNVVEGINRSYIRDKREEHLKTAIELYKDNLLNDYASEHWVVPKAVKYRDMYLQAVFEYIQILKQKNMEAEIIPLIEKAESIIGETDLLSIEKKIITGEADTDEQLNTEYAAISSQFNSSIEEVEMLKAEMEEDDGQRTAFVCDFKMFKEIYHLQRRLLARTGETMYLSILTICASDEENVSKKMFTLIETAKRSLRCGDSICKYSDNKLAVMFPAGEYGDAKKVLERIRSVFMKKIGSHEDTIIVFSLKPLKNLKDL